MNPKLSISRCRQAFALWSQAVLAHAVLLCVLTNIAPAQSLRSPIPWMADASNAAGLLEQAIVRLQRQPSVAASIRQRIDLYGRRLVGSGSYRQMNTGTDLLFRMELKVPIGDTITSLLQVCDGRFLWTYRALPHEQSHQGLKTTLNRVDLDEVRKRSASHVNALAAEIGYGGLPGMLKQTLQLYEFSRAEQGVLYNVPVWLMEGSWRAEVSQRLLAAQEGDRSRPTHVPDTVRLAIGIDDLFPYRIEHRTAFPDTTANNSAAMVAGGDARTVMTLEFFEVQTGLTIDPQMFYFRPTDVQIENSTESFIRNQLLGQPTSR